MQVAQALLQGGHHAQGSSPDRIHARPSRSQLAASRPWRACGGCGGDDLPSRALANHFTVTQECKTVAQHFCACQIVRRGEDGGSAGCRGAEQLDCNAAGGRIKGLHGLIEDQHGSTTCQCLRKQDLSFHPVTERANPSSQGHTQHAKEVQASGEIAFGVVAGCKVEQLTGTESVVKRRLARCIANEPAGLKLLHQRIPIAHLNVTRVTSDDAHDALEERCLAGTVGSGESEYLALCHTHAHATEDGIGAIRLDQ